MKCEFCGRDEPLPFVCNYCGGAFCGDHRLPEAHQCKGDLSQRRMVIPPPQQTTFTWSDAPQTSPEPQHAQGKPFSVLELRDIAVAWAGLGLAFTIALWRNGLPAGLQITDIFLISLITVGTGFVLHEMSHKFTAQNYGYWAEFRMWPLGLVLALATSFLGLIFAAPGATYISGYRITTSENAKISLAGPLTNVGVAALFFPLIFVNGTFFSELGAIGAYINIFLAMFNMVPIMPLDGAKVFAWSKVRWAAVFVPLVVVFVIWASLAIGL